MLHIHATLKIEALTKHRDNLEPEEEANIAQPSKSKKGKGRMVELIDLEE